ncbi:MAG TPA: extracellular solute-binding protein [Jatrophihabitans sp.]|nr:extracellular solute-binding protein [Jatrophihabitans sp.]
MRAGRRLHWSIAALGGLVLSLATACSSGGGGGKPTSNPSLDSLAPAALAAQAKKEGSLTWYTTFSDDDVQPFLAAFHKDYPDIKVDALRLSADKIPPRIITEQRGGKYNADVVSGDSPQIAQLIQAGALQPYTPKDLSPLPAGLDLPTGYEGVVYAVTTVVAYNPTVLKEDHLPVPTSWQDLTDPMWKGKFSIDPEAVNWYDSLVQQFGHDKAYELVKKLGDNDPVFVESHTDALTDVQAGEPAVAATAYGYKASDLKGDTPKQVEFTNSNPLPASLTLVDVVKNAPHPAAARLFEDWIVSKAGQQAIVDLTNHTSLRSDVTNDPAVWNPGKWTPAWGKPILSSNEYNSEVDDMNTALHAQ